MQSHNSKILLLWKSYQRVSTKNREEQAFASFWQQAEEGTVYQPPGLLVEENTLQGAGGSLLPIVHYVVHV
jgi:hypothetical protein